MKWVENEIITPKISNLSKLRLDILVRLFYY
jgi:hypothetical protein